METGKTPTPQGQYRSLGLKILSAAGFILVLIFGAWGVIQVGRALPQVSSTLSSAAVALSSIFISAERLTISIPSAKIDSGKPFILSWNHAGKRSVGTYTVTFGCSDGLVMQTVNETGTYQSVPCNVPINAADTVKEMTFVPTITTSRFLDVPFKIEFTRLSDGKVSASAETALTITNSTFTEPGPVLPNTPSSPTTPSTPSAPTTPSTPVTPTQPSAKQPVQPTYTYTTVVGRPSNPNGNPDLSVTILDVRSAYQNYGNYGSNATVRRGDLVAVRFVVENLGNKTVDNWNFNAVLPTMPMNIYSSEMQPSLAPGDKMQFTIQFDQADAGPTNGAFTVNIDPSNMVWNELNKNNNIAKVYLTILN